MRATADAAGAKLILVLMPPVSSAYTPALQQLGRQLGIPIVAPLTDQEMQPGDYDLDQYHLSARGRLRFTEALAHELLDVLGAT
jgi:hypothetical protein